MDQYAVRKYIIGAIFIFFGLILVSRLLFIQVINKEKYILSAQNNSRRYVPKYPARGLIYDRNGKLLVYNEAAYDLMIVKSQITPFDTTELAYILNIDKETIIKKFKNIRSKYKPQEFVNQVSADNYSVLQEKLHKYSGFIVQPRTLRKYPYKSAAHLLGYVGEVDEKIIEQNDYYVMGDYIGISGVEQYYEKELRGTKGGEYYQVDVKGRITGRLNDGEYDKPSHVGQNITLTIDIDLQNLGEKFMQNKIGSVVAIEPKTGEILALVSSPNYDPNLLTGRSRTPNIKKLLQDSLNPLFNRALMAGYPPGSTFKTLNALIGLQEQIITPFTSYGCNNGYTVGNFHLGCHSHRSPLDLRASIENSCNAYYCNVFRHLIDHPKYGSVKDGFVVWYNHLKSFGLGQKLDADFFNERSGYLPLAEDYDKRYGTGAWRSLMVVSLAIGQGEFIVSPMQMANVTATIANKGFFYTPHIIKSIEDNDSIDAKYRKPHYTTIEQNHFIPVIEGMERVVHGDGGTARWHKIPDITMCGKTGTAENPHGEDHSIFIAFAPKDDPQIAIAVYVENAGFGSTWAAPIASMMIEQYIKDTISKPAYYVNRILEKDLIHAQSR